jgi:hypothetical protein
MSGVVPSPLVVQRSGSIGDCRRPVARLRPAALSHLRIDRQNLSRETAGTTARERGHQTSSALLPTTYVPRCGRSLHHIHRRHGQRGVVVHGPPWRRATRSIAAKARSLRLFQGAIRWRCMDSCQNPASLTARMRCALDRIRCAGSRRDACSSSDISQVATNAGGIPPSSGSALVGSSRGSLDVESNGA